MVCHGPLWKSEDSLKGWFWFSPSTVGVSGTELSGQIQQQVPLAAEASHHLSIIFFKLNSSKT